MPTNKNPIAKNDGSFQIVPDQSGRLTKRSSRPGYDPGIALIAAGWRSANQPQRPSPGSAVASIVAAWR